MDYVQRFEASGQIAPGVVGPRPLAGAIAGAGAIVRRAIIGPIGSPALERRPRRELPQNRAAARAGEPTGFFVSNGGGSKQ